MAAKFFALLSLALLSAGQAEYNYNENSAKAASASSSGEDFLSDYHTPSNNALNSEATPDGYDYVVPTRNQFAAGSRTASVQASNLLQNAASAANAESVLLPSPLPVLRNEQNSEVVLSAQQPEQQIVPSIQHQHSNPVVVASVLRQHQEPEVFPPASYSFNYAVNDESTGDIKEHSETRDGYVVRGFYSLVDPDGYKRTVTYTADDVHGFNAVVNRVPYALKTVVVPVAQVAQPTPFVARDERSKSVAVIRSSGAAAAPGTVLRSGAVAGAGSSSGTASGAGSGAGSRVANTFAEDSYANAPRGLDASGGPYA
ncbi:uncharacterized protein LOC6542005 [Drosophila erecta]|uniref:Uncharacterized protein n=1 Tax=Drosophila erecta TaxID=7220 RepID=B3NA72_DROER|nr:uncharacterized protein LOC6542005 [Drosophila erecta]EDV57535.1 uncharacterized protein Dere_GG24889 [Drosophila erecta]